MKSERKGTSGNVKTALFLDGHKSRWIYEGLSHLHKNNAIAICLPSHTSIITQPNDNGINVKFHEEMGAAMKPWRAMHTGMNIAKGDANWCIVKAWQKTRLCGVLTRKGFGSQTTGVCPSDRHAVNYRDLKLSVALVPSESKATESKTCMQRSQGKGNERLNDDESVVR